MESISKRNGWWHRLVFSLLACAAFATAGGCTYLQGVRDHLAYNDFQNDFVVGWRNRAWAYEAWQLQKHNFLSHPHLDHFGAGFQAGYQDVANGASGCTPALPPRKYWSWKYQTPEGQAKVDAWFAGYPHGARAAEEDGAGNWSQIQVSERVRGEYRLGHKPPYNQQIFLHNPENWCPPDGTIMEGAPAGASPTLQDPSQLPSEKDSGSWNATGGMTPWALPTLPAANKTAMLPNDFGVTRLPAP